MTGEKTSEYYCSLELRKVRSNPLCLDCTSYGVWH